MWRTFKLKDHITMGLSQPLSGHMHGDIMGKQRLIAEKEEGGEKRARSRYMTNYLFFATSWFFNSFLDSDRIWHFPYLLVTEDSTFCLLENRQWPNQGEESGNSVYKSGHLGIPITTASYVNVSGIQMQDYEHIPLSRTVSISPKRAPSCPFPGT